MPSFNASNADLSVAIWNTFLNGGAANAAQRLHAGLQRIEGVSSEFWYGMPDAPPDSSFRRVQWEGPRHVLGKLRDRIVSRWRKRRIRKDQQVVANRTVGLEHYSLSETRRATRLTADQLGCDLLNLHWVSGDFIDYGTFFDSLPSSIPLVWTLHDMNPFTGGCHFSGGCEAFQTGCANCPQLPERGPKDLSYRSFQRKRQAFAGRDIHIVTPSRWLDREARSSRLLGSASSYHVIPYGLDNELYAPLDKQAARAELALPKEGVVVAFGAEYLANRRKGFAELLAALELLKTETPIIALVFGRGTATASTSWPTTLAQTRVVGFLNNPADQQRVYSAADLFVLPSLEDNLPQTGMEALACGTPVVAFETGGIPDYVQHGRTGLLAPCGDSPALAQAIAVLADRPALRRAMGAAGRELMVREFDLENQARKYADLFRSLVSNAGTYRRAA